VEVNELETNTEHPNAYNDSLIYEVNKDGTLKEHCTNSDNELLEENDDNEHQTYKIFLWLV
jgi:hypothetical protein